MYGKLPFTGAGVVVGGLTLGQFWLVAIAVGLVLVGVVAVRLSFRRGKSVTDA